MRYLHIQYALDVLQRAKQRAVMILGQSLVSFLYWYIAAHPAVLRTHQQLRQRWHNGVLY